MASLHHAPQKRQRIPMMDGGTLEDRTRPVRAERVRLGALLLRSGLSTRPSDAFRVERAGPAVIAGRRD